MNKSIRCLTYIIYCFLVCFSGSVAAQVGIGTTSPQAALDVHSSNAGILIPRVELNSIFDSSSVKAPDGTNAVDGTLVYNTTANSSGANFINKGFHYWESGRWVAFTDADWFRRFSTQVPHALSDDIYTNGKVGIGTNTPDYELEVEGSVLIHQNHDLILGAASPSIANAMRLSHDGTNTYFDSRGKSTLFRGSASNTGSGDNIILTIDNATGHMGIGPDTPLQRLHVQNGNIRIDTDYKLQFGEFYENTDPINFTRVNTGSDLTELQLMIGDNGNPGDIDEDFFAIGIRDNATDAFIEKFKFGATGTAFKPGGGSWAALSDRRVKKNIQPFTYGLSAINKINPVTYQYNSKAGYGNTKTAYVGVIAQEIENVLPMTVTTHKENGFDDLRKYDPTALTYALVNAVKELNTNNNDLEEKAVQLEALADQLEQRLLKIEKND